MFLPFFDSCRECYNRYPRGNLFIGNRYDAIRYERN